MRIVACLVILVTYLALAVPIVTVDRVFRRVRDDQPLLPLFYDLPTSDEDDEDETEDEQ